MLPIFSRITADPRMSNRLPIALFLVVLLSVIVPNAAAVTCDFDYELTLPPNGVGLRSIELDTGSDVPNHALIWYPAEHSTAIQITDEREPGRVNMRDYLWLARWGTAFNEIDLGERMPYLLNIYHHWQARGATQVSVTHMMAARMHGRIGAVATPPKGIVLGVIDPVFAETLAGHGLIVVSFAHPIITPQARVAADTLKALVEHAAATIPEFASLPKAWMATGPESVDTLQNVDKTLAPKAIVLTHSLTGKPAPLTTGATLLMFYSEDLPKDAVAAFKPIKAIDPRFVFVPGFEQGIVTYAPYEACTRKAFANTVYQGMPLHERRVMARALILANLQKALDIDLKLEGTNVVDPAALTKLKIRQDKSPSP